ncbi:hypothetical protein SPBR_05426 [Sporothrix brasiliensis 5110]|uniref:Aminoglycoside phosphotransferase domain-containing protein n=1 Tax=Sporothrix brasiliensis 5110 TaxID=1398154 RepID=A0A0C2IRQ4_9PEZI|nr:uncharacterized protein SPBR_05426 [Sporothrix brasiliensis 5110]KIH87662.1 hypothetical protein SPBR_05426 [Sporothrix brasiliensis 5110]
MPPAPAPPLEPRFVSAVFPLTLEQREAARRAFIDAVDPDAPCRVFRPHVRGSFNVCYFVEFDDGARWVVRFPIVSNVDNVWDKLQSEVATVR